jgi:4-methyl-5(b-hydroxyethyl)-thiazole monophosphate biosynthesis
MIKILTILITVFFICVIIYNLYENNYLKFPSFQLFPIIEGAKTINLASAIKSTVTKNNSKIASATGGAGLIKNIPPKKKPPQIKFTDLQNKMNDILEKKYFSYKNIELILPNENIKEDLIISSCCGGGNGFNLFKQIIFKPNIMDVCYERYNKLNKPYAAICAAPAVVLNSYGLLKDKKATAYPKFLSELPIPIADQAVVVDGNVITSQGPATSLAFSLTLVELLFGKDKSQQIAKEMLFI